MGLRLSHPSYRSLFVEMRSGEKRIGTATAFLAATHDGAAQFLVTNRHVVIGRHLDTLKLLDTKNGAEPQSLIVWHNSSTGLGHHVQVEVPLYDADGKPQWHEHLIDGPDRDFVAIACPPTPHIARYPYIVDAHAHLKVEPAQMVSVVGFPFAERTGEAFAVWATGFVASEPDLNHGGKPLFLIDCRGRKGQSGSPVIVHHGVHHKDANALGFKRGESDLLGVYSGRIRKDSDLGRVWKAWALAELLSTATGAEPNGRREDGAKDVAESGGEDDGNGACGCS
ncbi:MAG: serine protease [Burkholderiales bacterium]|nr:serine protease [Burkholderiales bacterium]